MHFENNSEACDWSVVINPWRWLVEKDNGPNPTLQTLNELKIFIKASQSANTLSLHFSRDIRVPWFNPCDGWFDNILELHWLVTTSGSPWYTSLSFFFQNILSKISDTETSRPLFHFFEHFNYYGNKILFLIIKFTLQKRNMIQHNML